MSVYIIAEIGVNHQGDKDIAWDLAYDAVRSGANAVKMQYWCNEYYRQCKWRKKLFGKNLKREDFLNIRDMVMSMQNVLRRRIDFFVTAFDNESFDFIDNELESDIYKIPSNEYVLKNENLVNRIIKSARAKNKRLFISTGKLTQNDIYQFNINTIGINTTFFHCVSKYPTQCIDAELSKIHRLLLNESGCKISKARSDIKVGLSDHSGLIEISVVSVALGVHAIEVHITRDKNDDGPDHKSSLDMNEFCTMIKMVRNVEKALNYGGGDINEKVY